MADVHQRLKLCTELLSLRDKIRAAPNNIKLGIMAAQRVKAIRNTLLGRSAGMLDEMLTPKLAAVRLAAELEAAKDKPAAERVAVAVYARGIIDTIDAIRQAEVRAGLRVDAAGFPDTLRAAIGEIVPFFESGYKQADPVIDTMLAHGAFVKRFDLELGKAAAASDDADEGVSKMTRLLAESFPKARAEYTRLVNAFEAAFSTSKTTAEEVAAMRSDYQNFMKEVYEPAKAAHDEIAASQKERAKAALTAVGEKILASLMDKSPIAPDAAEKWANSQEITKQAVARFRSIGYPVAQVRLDMAEFYRFTSGRVAKVRIHSDGDTRANATGIAEHGKIGTINLGSNFSKRVLWHEMAHHLESDPVAKMAAGQFIRRRATEESPRSLRSLSGHRGYRSDEVAFKGEFFDPYVGKVYRDGVTEVFAMGVDSFSNPETLARRAQQDPQTLEFVAGFVQSPIDPMAATHAALRGILLEMEEEAAGATGATLQATLDALAATVKLTINTDSAWMGGYYFSYEMAQAGRFEDSGYYLLKGKVRNSKTNRVGAGIMLVEDAARTGRIQRIAQISGSDMTVFKAMYALYKKNGVMPNYYSMNDLAYLKENGA